MVLADSYPEIKSPVERFKVSIFGAISRKWVIDYIREQKI
ncbi:hypothetical protein EZS27_016785 [termite gut metagenome]|jgi:hypothetical protein|uniref:Uncharacterized protein n=1 Tax=termite gut metagenome TaxID=433724 RepID=A0A5J4RNF3_9ZZZZ